MIDHISYYATDFAQSKNFYIQALAPLGYVLTADMVSTWDKDFPNRRLSAFGPPDKRVFWLIEVRTPPTPRHIAFVAKTRAAVDAFYRAALATGAKSEGAPGPRESYHPNYYGAFVIDHDGNNVEAVCHLPV